jgi:hypothetical protein
MQQTRALQQRKLPKRIDRSGKGTRIAKELYDKQIARNKKVRMKPGKGMKPSFGGIAGAFAGVLEGSPG